MIPLIGLFVSVLLFSFAGAGVVKLSRALIMHPATIIAFVIGAHAGFYGCAHVVGVLFGGEDRLMTSGAGSIITLAAAFTVAVAAGWILAWVASQDIARARAAAERIAEADTAPRRRA